MTINPRWAAFKYADYFKASQSVYPRLESDEQPLSEDEALSEMKIEFNQGDFDLRGFEVTRSEFFDSLRLPSVIFANKRIKFNTEIVRKFGATNNVELLINPVEGKFAIRKSSPDNRQSVCCSKLNLKQYHPREIPATAFYDTLFELFNWNKSCKYKIIGTLYEENNEIAYIFDIVNSNAYFQPFVIPQEENETDITQTKLITRSGKRVRAVPESWTETFGDEYYLHEQTLESLRNQNEKEWKLRLKGQLFETGKELNVTSFEELKEYINQELQIINE